MGMKSSEHNCVLPGKTLGQGQVSRTVASKIFLGNMRILQSVSVVLPNCWDLEKPTNLPVLTRAHSLCIEASDSTQKAERPE